MQLRIVMLVLAILSFAKCSVLRSELSFSRSYEGATLTPLCQGVTFTVLPQTMNASCGIGSLDGCPMLMIKVCQQHLCDNLMRNLQTLNASEGVLLAKPTLPLKYPYGPQLFICAASYDSDFNGVIIYLSFYVASLSVSSLCRILQRNDRIWL